MSTLEELYKKLEIYRKDFDNHDNVMAFADIADEIILKQDPASIPILLKYFDDEDRTDYVWEHLRKSLEYYPDKIYVNSLLENMGLLLPHARNWMVGMLYGIFNHEECYAIIKGSLSLVDKEKFLELLDIIYQESESHREQVEELRSILNANK